MKRKSSKINNPSPIKSSFPRNFHGFQTSKLPTETLADDNPKTSEYAFFKKFKENHAAGYKIRNQNQCSTVKSSESRERRSNVVENRLKEFNTSLFPSENVTTPRNFDSVYSVREKAVKKSVVDMKMAGTFLENAHSIEETIEEQGSQCKIADIFSRKRHKLHQLAINSSFPQVDEPCSKEYDLVSVLLSKLFPESIEEKNFELSKTRKLETDSKSRSLPSLESDMRFNKTQCTPATDLKLEYKQSSDIGFSSRWLEIPREGELPNPYSPSYYPLRTYLDDGMMELNYEIRERIAPIIWNEGDSAFDLHSKKHSSFTSGHLQELAEFDYPMQSLHRRQSPPLRLGWDFGTDKSNPSIHFQNAEQSLLPILPRSHEDVYFQNLDDRLGASEIEILSLLPYHSHGDVYFQNLDDRLGASEIGTLSLLPYHSHGDVHLQKLDDRPSSSELGTLSVLPYHSHGDVHLQKLDDRLSASELGTLSLPYHSPTLPSLQFSPSAGNGSHTFGERSPKVKDDLCPVLNGFSLSLPQTPNRLSLREYSYSDTISKASSILFSPESHLCFMTKALNEETCSTGVDFYLEPKCIPASDSWRNHYSRTCRQLEFPRDEGMSLHFHGDKSEISHHFCKDIINIHDWPSTYFQMSVDKEKVPRLLLDKPYSDEFEADIF
ncbi:uncharacterized protein LOC126654722 isoform X2 [Mercurialis annua]|uniref:uncharacterized protein LOC126654722 isoform X2 n=1 Tax=Mercurialis annua TaxID=3986 RepID=UPI00215F33F3|nr:uncharacterized protein LOC126654722 isoform X2 [Mercurialis annua]